MRHDVILGPSVCLFGAMALEAVALAVAMARPRWPLWLRAIWRLAVFLGLTWLLERAIGSPLGPNYAAAAQSAVWARIVEAGWWVIGARGLVGILRLLVVLEHRPRETQIISDLLAGAVYIATVLAIVNFSFEVPIRGLLATSGVIAIVLGLALQSTLSDVFSGIAVGLERPFKAGDLLWVEGNVEGRVIQVNWRSTQIATAAGNIAVIPNSIIAKARLVNHSLPSLVRRETVAIRLEAGAAPDHCEDVLHAAVQACGILLATPAPSIGCTSLHGDGNVFEINYSVADTDQLSAARAELLGQVHRHLRHAGIAQGVPGVASVPVVSVPTIAQILERSDLFGAIEPDQRDLLAKHLKPLWLRPGDHLIRQGDAADALYFIASGTAEISVVDGGAPRVVHRMGPGESLGAVGLITGTPYSATATALTQVKAYRLDRAAIGAAIAQMPALRSGLEALAERGQAALRRDSGIPEDPKENHPAMFLAKLRQFLSMVTE